MSQMIDDPPAQWAIDALQKQFADMGLGDLWSLIDNYIVEGTDTFDKITTRLRYDQSAQQVLAKRFPALKNRPDLDIPSYLALENQYKQVVQSAGLPSGFYDNRSDYTSWIESDVSPLEVQARIGTASQAVANSDPNVKQALRDYYGVDDAGIMAHFLDPKKAADVLTNQYRSAQAGGAYKAAGLNLDKTTAEQIGSGDYSSREMSMGAQQVAADVPTVERLNQIYADDVTVDDLTRDTFNLAGGVESRRKRGRLASKERATFNGAAAVNSSSLSQRQQV